MFGKSVVSVLLVAFLDWSEIVLQNNDEFYIKVVKNEFVPSWRSFFSDILQCLNEFLTLELVSNEVLHRCEVHMVK